MARIAWYQEKIGAYDQQIWEKSLEQQGDLKGLDTKPKKNCHIKPDLIDVDLVRGSTFSKAKPEFPWTALARKGLVRVLLFPFFFQWWIQVTSKSVSICILALYLMQVATVVLYLDVPGANASEVFGPMCLMLLLGTVHCQIVSTESSRSPSGSPAASNTTSPARRRRPRKSKGSKKSEEKNDGGAVPIPEGSNGTDKKKEQNNNKCGFGASDELSTDEEYAVQSLEGSPSPPDREDGKSTNTFSVRRRNVKSHCKPAVRPQKPQDRNVSPVNKKPKELERLKPNVGSRPASDTDDTMWEEILQGPDTASTASSDSEANARYSGGAMALQESSSQSSNDESLHQSITGNQLSWLQACHPSKDKVSAIIWEQGECKKADMSVLEMSGIILTRVKTVEQGVGYLRFGGGVTVILALLPFAFRLAQDLDLSNISALSLSEVLEMAVGPPDAKAYVFYFITTVQRICLTGLFFFMMCVAERTYIQRLLFAKFFSHLTSARKAKKSEVPHFRLKKVQNIKMWLALRSFLRRRGPQRSVDVIVSTIFLLALSISFIVCAQILHNHKTYLESLTNWELVVWGPSLLLSLLRFATLGSETNSKYSNSSVLLTEQINLYLKMEKKPNKKEELNIVNNVLKLATKLMKELDTPFRLLGLTVNPLIYNITKVVILSAVSAVVSDLLGFNIRLWKIKS
ncbi:putative homeodomain transcription factor 1 isoform X1 [Eucyclogobius newberryi]|uniref:putative homeodomain transcription factor 1 isoform X1 n=1 Tax=Eucyclogobius newberryi TaxID=166745 RepID=UPI003B59DBDF